MAAATGERNFEILRRDPRPPVSIACDFACVRGKFLARDTTDPTKVALATDFYLGVSEVEVIAGPRALVDVLQPSGLEQPIVKRGTDGNGGMISLVKVLEGEAETGDHLVLSGTGALSSGTNIGTELSITGGKLYATQTGDVVSFLVTAKPDPVTSGELRIRFEAVN